MKLIFNGEPRELPEPTTVAAFLRLVNLAERQVAVELNEEVVPRSRHAEQLLRDGDCLEVVSLVGGG